MIYRLFVYGIVFCLFLSCTGNFTPREIDIIREGEGVMRVWKIDNLTDSLFLRKKAGLLRERDLNSSTFRELKVRMLLTVNNTTDPGVGIAAPQVGIGKTLIAVQRFDKAGEPFEFYINPVIESYSETKILGPEGCLSVPDVMDSVWRADEIIISYVPDPELKKSIKNSSGIHDERDMRRKTEKVKGFTAVIFQHEIDHLDGILFIDQIKQ